MEKQAKLGTIYVEFDVREKSPIKTNEGWAKIVGPDSLEGDVLRGKVILCQKCPQQKIFKSMRIKRKVELKMFSEILIWIEKNSDRKLEIINNELISSAVINVDDDNNIARLTLWDDDSCVIEAINVDSGEYIINDRHEVKSLEDFMHLFRNFNSSLI